MSGAYAGTIGLGCIIGSRGFVEIFESGGSASVALAATIGAPVRVALASGHACKISPP